MRDENLGLFFTEFRAFNIKIKARHSKILPTHHNKSKKGRNG